MQFDCMMTTVFKTMNFDELHRTANIDLSQRALRPRDVAERLGLSLRTLEDWRRTWLETAPTYRADLRKGPPFRKVGRKRILYELPDMQRFEANYRRWRDDSAYWTDDPEPVVAITP